MTVKIAHEAPKSIFDDINSITDYTYILVHLLEEDEEYKKLAFKAKNEGREIILDNSIFELGTAFNVQKYIRWIKELRPDWYIIPDTLESTVDTIVQTSRWKQDYDYLPGKKIGVIQGKTYSDLVNCYHYMNKGANVDKIAISFDYSYYRDSVPHPNKHMSWMLGRVKLLGDLIKDDILNVNKPHHLLGCSLPIEGKFYRDYSFIDSVDTSNPVVHGIKNIFYEHNFGLYTKDSQKLVELLDESVKVNLDVINYNVKEFRKYWK